MNARMPQEMPKIAPVRLNGGPISATEVEDVAIRWRSVTIEAAAFANLEQGRRIVDAALSDGQSHYGINTGFGSLSRTRVAHDDLRALQRNLVRSHSAGVGQPLATATVRAMMLLLAASLCRGKSGVRPVVAQTIVDMLNHRLTPVVPSVGSVGASGDLAPLAHVALAMIGESVVTRDVGDVQASADAMRSCGIEPLQLEAKEGLALINGTHLMAAEGALLVCEAQRLFAASIVSCAMSIDACRGTDAHLDARVYTARNQPGPAQLATRLREALQGSEIIRSHIENDPRVQDPYSLRCAATVLGAAWDAASYVKRAIVAELGAVTDNPLVFDGTTSERNIVSAGNFHGMPLAIPLDTLCIAISHIAGISERRTFLMLAATDPESHLSAYLTPKPGLNSGLMIAQYTAAACCNEIIGLSMPASVANVSTSAGMEDYNSFGPRSAAKARRAIELARTVIAVELLCAAQGIEMHRPLRSGQIVERAIQTVRGAAPPLSDDRPIAPDMERVSSLIRDGAFGSETL